MSSKSNAHHSAKKLFKNDGVPSKIVMDGAKEQVLGKFKDACNDATVTIQQLEYNITHLGLIGMKVLLGKTKEQQDVP